MEVAPFLCARTSPPPAFVILDTRAESVLNHPPSFRLAFQYAVWQDAPSAECSLEEKGGVFEIVIEETTELNLPSRIESIAEAAAVAAEVAERSGFDAEALFGIDMAVREAVTNAVIHGNKQDETKQVEIGITTSGSALMISVRDRGVGFDPAAVPDPTAEQNLLKASGRGLLFMRSFMDDVRWEPHSEGGTVVYLTKMK